MTPDSGGLICLPQGIPRESVGRRAGNSGGGGLFAFFLRLRRKQHVVIEAVAAEIPVAAEIEINLCALRQPELGSFLLKRNRPVFDDLMLADQTNLWNWTYHFRLDSNDLKLVGCDPGPSLQLQRIDLGPDLVIMNARWSVVALFEVNQPRRLPVPIS